jgi:RNA polymerase sigma-70 factor (family 1)
MISSEPYGTFSESKQLADRALFAAIAGNDEAAFRILFETYRHKFYAAVFHFTKSSLTAEELTQEAFINIWRFRRKLTAVDDPAAYLYKIVFNLVHTYLRKESNEMRIRQLAQKIRGNADHSTGYSIEANETARLIAEAVERLPQQQKTVYKLSREQGLSYREIADELRLSPNTVRNHLVEALKSVRFYLKGHALGITVVVLDSFFS